MRVIRTLTGTILIAGLGAFAYAAVPPTSAPTSGSAAYAQQQQDQTPPKQDETKPKKDETKSPKAEKQQAQPKDQTGANRTQSRDEKQQPAGKQQARDERDSSKPMQAQKGGGGQHGRISDNDYHAHFGQQHHFSVHTVITTTRIVPNQTQFVYGGYTFVFVEAWPAGWAMTDDCYIDYIDGEYVIIDVAHPGVQITLNIVG